ncbi:MAG TPA: hypothetical protein ENI58_00740 [Nitrospirae bacterium]|jgi:hypothetical protein|nr:hypothetical protein [Nitrospirota bacterium]
MKEREDKSVLTEPRCPFCHEFFERPHNVTTDLGFFQGGICPCGAVYACDPTGRNLGEAFVDALTYACKEDWSLAWGLVPDEDYSQNVLNYNRRMHRVLPKRGRANDRVPSGKLIFIKVREGALRG